MNEWRYEVYTLRNGVRYFYAGHHTITNAYRQAKKLRQASTVEIVDFKEDIVHTFEKQS